MRFETTDLRSILGLRFRDAVTERPVTDGLRVTVRRVDGLGGPTRAVRTASGAYVAQGLPGLRGYERAGADVSTGSVPFWVAVDDEQGRFVPARLRVSLPYDPDPADRGMYPILETPSEIEGETREPTCYLFPAVDRPVTAGQSVVYADLVAEGDDGTLRPVPHAVLEVQHSPENGNANGNDADGATWFGVADADGRVAVQFPLPPTPLQELQRPPDDTNGNGPSGNGSTGNGPPGNGPPGNGPPGNRPPGNGPPENGPSGNAPPSVGGRPLSARTWSLTVRVRYEPSALDPSGGADRPVLPSIFAQQFGTLYADPSTPEATRTATLSYGEPLVLRTDGLPGDRVALRIAPHSGDS